MRALPEPLQDHPREDRGNGKRAVVGIHVRAGAGGNEEEAERPVPALRGTQEPVHEGRDIDGTQRRGRSQRNDADGPGHVRSPAPVARLLQTNWACPCRSTRPTNRETTEAAISTSTAEFCFPIKIFLGHVSQAARSDDHVFIPHLIAGEKTRITVKSVFCPYVQAAPSIARSSEALSEALGARLLSPVIDFAMPEAINVKALHSALKPFGIRKGRVAGAWKAGLRALEAYRQSVQAGGLADPRRGRADGREGGHRGGKVLQCVRRGGQPRDSEEGLRNGLPGHPVRVPALQRGEIWTPSSRTCSGTTDSASSPRPGS